MSEGDDDLPEGMVPMPPGSGWFGYSSEPTTVERYGITLDDYGRLLLEQDNKCAICLHPDVMVGPLVIDHDHVTGEVRGLLCNGCNTGLGLFRDNLTLLLWAVRYLETHGSDAVRASQGDEDAAERESRRHEQRRGPRSPHWPEWAEEDEHGSP
jgi:hypothetical protein